MMMTNDERAINALRRVECYGEDYEFVERLDQFTEADRDHLHQQMSDLVCDMRHLADKAGLEWTTVFSRSNSHYREEVKIEAER